MAWWLARGPRPEEITPVHICGTACDDWFGPTEVILRANGAAAFTAEAGLRPWFRPGAALGGKGIA